MHLINALHTSDLNCSKGYFKTNTPPIQILLINALHLTALLQMLLINAAPTLHLRHMHQINIRPIQILLINAFHRPVTSNAYNKHPSPANSVKNAPPIQAFSPNDSNKYPGLLYPGYLPNASYKNPPTSHLCQILQVNAPPTPALFE